jgi:CheY-like chemotaxis protein
MRDLKVLLVDDEQDFIQTLSERLESRSLETTLAFGGEEALEAVRENEPDLILLDLKMPGMDGMEVLRQVRKAFPRVQVVMLTGHKSAKAEEEARHLGAYAYLGKPVELEHLSRILGEAFENCRGSCSSPARENLPDFSGHFAAS